MPATLNYAWPAFYIDDFIYSLINITFHYYKYMLLFSMFN